MTPAPEEGVNVKSIRTWRDGKQSTHIQSLTVDGREIVAIDPENVDQVERLREAFNLVSGQDYDREWTPDMQKALHHLISPLREVFEHIVRAKGFLGSGAVAVALCGKVWQPNDRAEVVVKGPCPECERVSRPRWVA